MRDEEFVFYETNRERKQVGRGAFNKVRGGGRRVRTPSDNLSKKERDAMNGEVKGIGFARPMEWKAFLKLPRGLQEAYIAGVQERFPGISSPLIAESMGTKVSTFGPYVYRNGLSVNFGKGNDRRGFFKSEAGGRYLAWVNREEAPAEAVADVAEDVPAVVEDVPVEESVEETATEKKVENRVSMKRTDMSNIAALLSMLAGTGAKLTIEISL